MMITLTKVVATVLAVCQPIYAVSYYLPAETVHHDATLMAWPTKHSMYGRNVTRTRLEIASIVEAIGKYEPVKVFVYNDTDNLDSARKMLRKISAATIYPTFKVDSLWARDTGPMFVRQAHKRKRTSGVAMNFNEWGQKLRPTADSKLAKAVLRTFDVPIVTANFTSEGGALEHDGQGTMMATESSILNKNRNPGKSKADIEREFAWLFGIKKTIWFKGSHHSDITDAHVDGLARFVSPGKVALSHPGPNAPKVSVDIYNNAKKVLAEATDAKGRCLEVVEVPEPDYANYPNLHSLCIEYVNWYTVNGAVILAGFQDKEVDAKVKSIVQKLFPDLQVEQVQLYELARQGGGIHCATQPIIGHHIDD